MVYTVSTYPCKQNSESCSHNEEFACQKDGVDLLFVICGESYARALKEILKSERKVIKDILSFGTMWD